MLDEKGNNEFHIIVNHQKLEEIKAQDGKTFVVMPLFSKAAYGVEFVEEFKGHGATEKISQKWPVCPYRVAVRNLSGKVHSAELYVDGQNVRKKHIPAGGEYVFDGIPTDDGFQELLFSLPRFATLDEKSKDSDGDGRALKRSRASEIGTIKIVFRECVKTGEKFSNNHRASIAPSFTQANKLDAKATGGGGAAAAAAAGPAAGGTEKAFASTTRAGRVIRLNEPRSCMVTYYDGVGETWEARLLYRTQSYLEDIGVLQKQETVSDAAVRKAKRARRRKKAARLQQGGGPSHPLPVPVEDGPPPVPDDDEVIVL